jgi:glycosyltransferase involved in cell wall biosynthesis
VSTKAVRWARSKGVLLRMSLFMVFVVCLLQLMLHFYRTQSTRSTPSWPAPTTFLPVVSHGINMPAESTASERALNTIFPNTSLCVGIPLRQVDPVDDAFLFALRDAIEFVNLTRIVLSVVAQDNGSGGGNEASSRVLQEIGASSLYGLRHVKSLRPIHSVANATLGTMLNMLLEQFLSVNNLGGNSSSLCSHVLLLDPSRTVIKRSFVATMIRELESANAYAASCTTFRNGGSGSPPHIFDRGFNVSLGQSFRSTRPTISREFFGYSSKDVRLRDASPIHFLSPHCILLNWHRIIAASPNHVHPPLQVPADVAAESTLTELILQDFHTSDRLRVMDVLQLHQKRLGTELSNITLAVLRSLPNAGRAAIRQGFKILVEAQSLLAGLHGKHWESRNMSARLGPLTITEDSAMTLCRVFQTEANTTAWLQCLTTLVAAKMDDVKEWVKRKGFLPPEEHVGWSLSMAIRGLVNRSKSTLFVASTAACLLNHHNVRRELRPFLLPQEELTATKVLDMPSYALERSNTFWKAHHDLAAVVFPSVFGRFQVHVAATTGAGSPFSPTSLFPPHLRVVWDSFCCHCCGFSNEIVHLLVPLQKRMDVRTPLEQECFCPGFPMAVANSLERSFMPKSAFPVETVAPDEITVWISHTEPTRYNNAVFQQRRPDYVVGRSMYEFTKIEAKWIEPLEKECDEVWVPASFVATAFINSGVNASKVVIIPEAIDTYFYDAAAHDPIALPLAEGGGATRPWKHFCNRPEDANTAASYFKFFSNFKWESRKGWDILFSAYFTAFSRGDHVSLYVLTHIWTNSAVETFDSKHNETRLREHLVNVTRSLGITPDLAQLPHFCIIIDDVEEGGVAQLYRSTDAFVLPTRGEGWGLPVMQAMSMGMPVISTGWGGQTDFMNDANSFLIPVDAVEEIPKDSEYRWESGKMWAVPSLVATKRLMRLVATDRAIGSARGAAARQHISKYFSEEAVADIVEARLHQIRQIVVDRRRSQQDAQRSARNETLSF